MKVSLYRRQRSARFGHELYNHDGVTWLNVWWGSPTEHKWWAASVYLFVRGA